MSLFDAQISPFERFLAAARRSGKLITCSPPRRPWPAGQSLVLAEDAACELGNPSVGSAFALLWSDSAEIGQGRVLRVGADLNALAGKSASLGLFVLLRAAVTDREYERYTQARDLIVETRLAGLMTRMLPARQNVWCRVSRDAAAAGFTFGHWGHALLEKLAALDFVAGADVLFVANDAGELAALTEAAQEAGRVVAALSKLHNEPHAECSQCEFTAICNSVEDLRRIRNRIMTGRQNG